MNDIREDLKAYIDDELTPERAAQVQAAIDQDPALREEYLFMKLLSGEIKSAAKQPQVAGLDAAVGKTAKSGLGFKINKWAVYGASGVAAVMLIGFLGSSMSGPDGSLLGIRVIEGLSNSPADVNAGAFPAEVSKLDHDAKTAKPGGAMNPTITPDNDSTGSASSNTGGDVAKQEAPVAGGAIYGEDQPADGFTNGSPTVNGEARSGLPETERGGDGYGFAGKGAKAKSSGEIARNRDADNRLGFSTSPSHQSFAPPQTLDRKVIRTADMGIKVKDVGKAMEETEAQVAAMGGFVENQNFNQAEDSSRGRMYFQVPEKNFDAIVDYLKKLGTIVKNNKTGQDVTGQIAYTDGQVHSLADEEENLIKELERTKNSGDRLEIRSRLSRVRQEMQGLKEQNKATKDLADMSRFILSFERSGQLDEAKPGDWFGQTTQGAGNVLGFFGRIFGVGLIYTVFLAPVWLPIGGFVWWLRRRARMASAGSE